MHQNLSKLIYSLGFFTAKRSLKLGLSRQNLILLIGIVILFYIFLLFLRIGIWIMLGLTGIAMIFFLLQDIPSGLYYLVLLSYGAIGLYNLHIALFWTAEEWDEIDENITTQNIEEV